MEPEDGDEDERPGGVPAREGGVREVGEERGREEVDLARQERIVDGAGPAHEELDGLRDDDGEEEGGDVVECEGAPLHDPELDRPQADHVQEGGDVEGDRDRVEDGVRARLVQRAEDVDVEVHGGGRSGTP